jgi:hypothetical protein
VNSVPRRLLARAIALLLLPAPAWAQSFTPPPQVGSVTLAWQWVDNTGHIWSDGSFHPLGQSVTTSVLAEVDYGVSERFAATLGIPFIFAKYTGANAPVSGLPRDSCRCWNSSFQDFSIAGRYRFGDEFWALTPSVRLIVPSHDYPYRGEAVVGPNLRQMLMGFTAAWRLADVLPKASIEGGYSFALVQKPTPDTGANRSNATASFGYSLTRSIFVHTGALFQKNHGGLTISEIMAGLPPDERTQTDRLLKMRYWHMTGGVSYSTRFADVFVAVQPYVWGRDTHDGVAYTVGSTWYFDFSRPKP